MVFELAIVIGAPPDVQEPFTVNVRLPVPARGTGAVLPGKWVQDRLGANISVKTLETLFFWFFFKFMRNKDRTNILTFDMCVGF